VLWAETVTVGPPFYNRWIAPVGILLLLLMGVAPLFGWRKTSGDSLKRAFAIPLTTAAVVAVTHLIVGPMLGFPAIVQVEAASASFNDAVLQRLAVVAPLVTVALVGFNFAVIGQEFYRGVRARRRNAQEGVWQALLTLVARSRRRYGGYIVHVGVGLMFLGFVGKAWDLEREANLLPGQTETVGDYQLTYQTSRMEVDAEKRMVFADVLVSSGGKELGSIHPAQFIYTKSGNPTTEVAMMHRVKDDLYVVVGSINPTTKRATFRFHVNPLVSWIWVGVLVLMFGAGVSLWPEVSWKKLGVWGSVRLATGAATGVMFAILIASAPARTSSVTAVGVDQLAVER
jgi:cytochrome c-type biogenesis protein CcmF